MAVGMVQLGRRELEDLEPEEVAELASLLDEAPVDRSSWERLAPLEESSFDIEYELGVDAPLPDLLPVIRLARFASAEARAAVAADDDTRFLLALRGVIRIGRALCREPLLFPHAVGASIERRGHHNVAEYLRRGRWSRSTLDALAVELGELDCGSTIAEAMAGEAVLVASQDPSPVARVEPGIAGRLTQWVGRPFLDLPLAGLAEGRRRELEHLNESYATYREMFEEGDFRPDSWAALYDILAPSITDLVGKARATQTSRLLGRLALRAAIARAETGRFPDDLPELRSPCSDALVQVAELNGGGLELAEPRTAELIPRDEPRATRPVLVWSVPDPVTVSP